MRITFTVDNSNVMAALRKKSAAAVEKRAQLLGDRTVEAIEDLIDNELGGGDGSSTRRGMVSMHSIPFHAQVDSGGDLPVTVAVRAIVSGATAAKFGAHEYGAGAHQIPGPLSFPGTGAEAFRKVVVPRGRSATHPGTPGKRFMLRGMRIAVGRMIARF